MIYKEPDGVHVQPEVVFKFPLSPSSRQHPFTADSVCFVRDDLYVPSKFTNDHECHLYTHQTNLLHLGRRDLREEARETSTTTVHLRVRAPGTTRLGSPEEETTMMRATRMS